MSDNANESPNERLEHPLIKVTPKPDIAGPVPTLHAGENPDLNPDNLPLNPYMWILYLLVAAGAVALLYLVIVPIYFAPK